jgi:hypothetical protein
LKLILNYCSMIERIFFTILEVTLAGSHHFLFSNALQKLNETPVNLQSNIYFNYCKKY